MHNTQPLQGAQSWEFCSILNHELREDNFLNTLEVARFARAINARWARVSEWVSWRVGELISDLCNGHWIEVVGKYFALCCRAIATITITRHHFHHHHTITRHQFAPPQPPAARFACYFMTCKRSTSNRWHCHLFWIWLTACVCVVCVRRAMRTADLVTKEQFPKDGICW